MALAPSIRIRVQTRPKIRLRVTPAIVPTDATVEVGTVTTLVVGAPATVVNVGTASAAILNFGLPTGATGAAGIVQSVVAGSGISVDSTNPAAPVIASTAGAIEATIHAATSKATPDDADELALVDSAASFGLKKLTWANLKATAKTYFDTLYQPLLATLTSWAAITRASGFDTFVATPTSANLRALLTDEVGTGAAYFVGGGLGTPASGSAANLTGLPVASGISGLGTGVATFLATPTSANLIAAVTDETGSGALVFGTSPVIATPSINTINLTGGQIAFPATDAPSSNANTLDDYEEGTFTPTLIGLSTAGTGTYSTQTGKYTKIGNLVAHTITCVWSAHTGTGSMAISNLPFVSAGVGSVASLYFSSMTFTGTPQALMVVGVSQITIETVATTAASAGLAMDTAATIRLSGQYFTS